MMVNRLPRTRRQAPVSNANSDTSIGPPVNAPLARPESIDAWLDVLVRLMHLPERDRSAIRVELAEHLRERTRDLMLTGLDESDAINAAINELGELAQLAKRFDKASRSTRRRKMMNTALLGLTAVIATAGVVMIAPSSAPEFAAVYEDAPDQSPPPAQATTTRITLDAEMTPRDYFASLTKSIDLGLTVDWNEMADAGFEPDEPIGLSARNVTVLKSLEFLREASERREGELFDWRFADDMLILGIQSNFDRRERVLVSYNIAHISDGLQSSYGLSHEDAVMKIVSVFQELVEPENWADMGGAVGETVVVGGNLFVKAPPRMHKQLVWILEQLRDEHEAHAHRDGRAGVPGVGAGGAGGAGGAAGAPGATGAGGTGMRIPGAGRPAPSPGGAR